MKIAFNRANPAWSGTIVTNLFGLNAFAERYIRVQISELTVDHTFEILSFEIAAAAGTCTLAIIAMDQSAFDWAPGEEGEQPVVPVGF
jgi:hypothetical protein